MSISVLILTLNEEANLPRCLDAVRWSDDIVVVDSGSADRTVDIARAAGARVLHRKFDSEDQHRLWCLREIPFKYPWVYNPDADEVTTPELHAEMVEAVSTSPNVVAFRVRFKNFLMGKWIRFSSLYPTWVVRLFRPECISFRRGINLEYVVDGPVGRLESHFLHYSFNKGFRAWFEKHARYAEAEAYETIRSLQTESIRWRDLISFDAVIRRRALKILSFRMPFRPFFRFVYMYVVRLGFLDGIPGFTYCSLISFYEYMIVLSVREIRHRENGKAI